MSERQSQKARFSGDELSLVINEFARTVQLPMPGAMEKSGDAVYLLKPEDGVIPS